ncbi:sodium/potassium-transporting ATPase subunit beta-2 [Drosophila grimshawi]|uniref:sodium/potassium-transporting ATPase subunit beta-2 n=1 Tax=Drosophila grimshawi TaxID=7222 RepID=UPI000C8705C7|nr:sodium/potassium-transporting ATPase subunit beta-2 [Drosophila grimshawi]
MPQDFVVAAGEYNVRKQFRNEGQTRKAKDMPWSKKILDLDRNQFFGRTLWGWTRIVLFYLFLYCIITVIMCLWVTVFYFSTYDPITPVCRKKQPGVSVVPACIDEFLFKLDPDAEAQFADCNRDKVWGYEARIPCVFIKINKVIGYKPETYEDVDELPSDSPGSLTTILENYSGSGRIWMTCDITNGKSTEIKYFPGPYFDTTNGLDGISRVIAMQLRDLPQKQDVSFICTTWAKNIEIDTKYNGVGNVKFSIHMS